MKVKTDGLFGSALDWAVAKCQSYDVAVAEGTGLVVIRRHDVVDYFDPSNNWGWGGSIIDQHHISTVYVSWAEKDALNQPWAVGKAWTASIAGEHTRTGPTALIAAMRCYVASKLGDEVEIPEELL
jgi:hypothetical protein